MYVYSLPGTGHFQRGFVFVRCINSEAKDKTSSYICDCLVHDSNNLRAMDSPDLSEVRTQPLNGMSFSHIAVLVHLCVLISHSRFKER